jgi:hypothetical protein
VFNKRNPTKKLNSILLILSPIVCAICYFRKDDFIIGSPIFYLMFGFIIAIGILGVVKKVYIYSPVGRVSELTVTQTSIVFFEKQVLFSDIEQLIVEVTDDDNERKRTPSNRFEIKTRYGPTFEMGIVIDGQSDIKQINLIMRTLKQKIENVTYRNFV